MEQPHSILSLDPPTLIFCISVFGLLMSVVAYSASCAFQGNSLGLLPWSRGMAMLGAAFFLFYLRGHAPVWLSSLTATLLVLCVPALVQSAYTQLFEAEPPRRRNLLITLFGMMGPLGNHFLDWSREASTITMSASLALNLGAICLLVLNHGNWRALGAAALSAMSIGLLALVLATRAAMTLMGAGESMALMSSSGAQTGILVLAGMFTVAESVGFILMVHERHRQLALECARRDGLTGLYTRSAFFEQAEAIAQRATPLCLLMIDIDHFKAINDSHGHAVGDMAIRHAARVLERSLRSADLAGRYGGEEFCVLMRGCGPHEAEAFAQRLVREIREQSLRLPQDLTLQFTVSVGHACGTGGGESLPALMERADQALYGAKRGGRNRAQAASPLLLAAA